MSTKNLVRSKCRIIAFINHKGGVGKTTSVLNVGAALAKKGLKTLLIDLDAQANLSISVGLDGESYADVGQWLDGQADFASIVKPVQANLDIMPATLYLRSYSKQLLSKPNYNYLLKTALANHTQAYDYIIIDCPPALDVLTSNALVASTDYIIPLQAEFLPFRGVSSLMQFVGLVQEKVNPDLQLLGIFLTKYNPNIRGRLKEDVATKLYSGNYKDAMFSTYIRHNAALAESPALGTTVLEHSPTSNGAKDYISLTSEILARHGK